MSLDRSRCHALCGLRFRDAIFSRCRRSDDIDRWNFDAGALALRETADRFLFVVDRLAVGINFSMEQTCLGLQVPRRADRQGGMR
jgi:hypothetical protein